MNTIFNLIPVSNEDQLENPSRSKAFVTSRLILIKGSPWSPVLPFLASPSSLESEFVDFLPRKDCMMLLSFFKASNLFSALVFVLGSPYSSKTLSSSSPFWIELMMSSVSVDDFLAALAAASFSAFLFAMNSNNSASESLNIVTECTILFTNNLLSVHDILKLISYPYKQLFFTNKLM